MPLLHADPVAVKIARKHSVLYSADASVAYFAFAEEGRRGAALGTPYCMYHEIVFSERMVVLRTEERRWCAIYGSPGTGGVRNTSGFTVMSPPGEPGGCGEARGVPHLGQAKPQ